MDLQPKISVIIPIYNVSDYIQRCARSLFEQSLDSIEFIFIDDNSPDESIDILTNVSLEYPKRSDQIKIIRNKVNQGQAAVRKQGILESKGEFIIHCDADDWVDSELYEKMYETAKKENADIVFCDIINETPTGQLIRTQTKTKDSGKKLIQNWYYDPISLYCWNKLVKKDLIIDNKLLPWEGLNMWEDNGLLSRILYYSGKISYVEKVYYHYNRCNISSITYKYGEKETNQMIQVAKNLEEFFMDKIDKDDFKDTVNAFKYYAKLNLITDSFRNYMKYKKIFPESNYIKKHIPLDAFSNKGRIRFQMVKYGLAPLFIIMFKIKTFLYH